MSESWVESVESRLWSLGRRIWRGDEKAELREEVLRAVDDLRKRHDALKQARAELEAMRKRIAEDQANAALLTAAVDNSLARGAGEQAYRLALELDGVRRRLAADQTRLPRQEQLCWSLDFQLRRLERNVARMQQRLLCVS
jgi:hypothetical protein